MRVRQLLQVSDWEWWIEAISVQAVLHEEEEMQKGAI